MSGAVQMPFFTGWPQGMPGQIGAPFGQAVGPSGSVNMPQFPGQAIQPGPYGMPFGRAPNAPAPQVPPMFAQAAQNPNLSIFGHFANLPLQPPGALQAPQPASTGSPAAALAALLASLQAGPRYHVPAANSFNPQPQAQAAAPTAVAAAPSAAPAAAPFIPPGPPVGVVEQGSSGGAGESSGGGQ